MRAAKMAHLTDGPPIFHNKRGGQFETGHEIAVPASSGKETVLSMNS